MGTKGTNNRLLILEAANHLFHVRGYNQTSFSDISDETGIPRGNFYYYFKTKEEILEAVIEFRVQFFNDMLDQCDADTDDPLQRLISFAKMPLANADSLLAHGCPVGSMSTELAKNTPELCDKAKEVFEVVRHWMAIQFDALGVSDSSTKAMDFMARLQGISVVACAFKDRDFLQTSTVDIENWLNNFSLK